MLVKTFGSAVFGINAATIAIEADVTILPPFTLKEALETTKIHSVAGRIDKDTSMMIQRPFRSLDRENWGT